MRLGGLTEVAQELGISRQRAGQLKEKADFPKPVGRIAAGSIWDLDLVRAWNDSASRRPGRPSDEERERIIGGRFLLQHPAIGSGGFADVYRAIDTEADPDSAQRVVAIKILRDVDEKEQQQRFKRELRIVSDLRHENVVPVLAFGENEQDLWYAMPLAKGSLSEQLDEFFGDEVRIREVMRQICRGLAYVHEREVCHRDLKPANILWMRSDSWSVADFGLARHTDRRTTALTTTNQGLGTFAYAAPEVWTDAKFACIPADIYSLGKILQELITGEIPLSHEPPAGIYRATIKRATRSDPSKRFPTVAAFVEALEQASETLSSTWESVPEAVQRLMDRVRGDSPDPAALAHLVRLALDDKDIGRMSELSDIIPTLSLEGIGMLWDSDPDGCREMVDRYARYVSATSWDFAFCDVIADFLERCVRVTKDADILSSGLSALLELGYSHHRWHVQDVAIQILQRIREGNEALAALDALRDSRRAAIEWTLSDFAIRSLHPTLRKYLEGAMTNDHVADVAS